MELSGLSVSSVACKNELLAILSLDPKSANNFLGVKFFGVTEASTIGVLRTGDAEEVDPVDRSVNRQTLNGAGRRSITARFKMLGRFQAPKTSLSCREDRFIIVCGNISIM